MITDIQFVDQDSVDNGVTVSSENNTNFMAVKDNAVNQDANNARNDTDMFFVARIL